MNRLIAFLFASVLCLHAPGAWYWPFGSDDARKPPRISELMEPASVLIDEASDLAADGKHKEAVEKYREALAELDRVELENPERAGKPEFATVRNKRAYVNAAIDSMLMSQVQQNAKAVAVSDTTELEKKLAEERAAEADKKAKAKKEERKVPGKKDVSEPASPAVAESAPAKPVAPAKPATVRKAATRSEQVIADIAAGEFDAAALVIGEMLEEKPNGAAALNLKAAMETAQGKYKEAERTLDRAIMSNPRSHYAYYNMARLILQSRPDGRTTARRYYETGRAVGGPVDSELEGLVK